VALARRAGVVSNYPSRQLDVQGYTDSSGSAALNQSLSEQRADNVRDFLIPQNINAGALSATGFGASNFVADNSMNGGRQRNRRVEIVACGEVSGTKIGGTQ
jgi:outer membrane protein OmpA-like peptidoglycan-associated protein